MFIAAGTLTEFLKFLQIFFWITVPLLFTAVIITTIVHYKRKSRKRAEEKLAEDLLLSLPPDAEEGEFAADITLQASIDQLKDFRNKLYFSNARYSGLKKDLNRLEEKYNDLLSRQKIEPSNINNVENISDINPAEMQFQYDRLKENYATEKEDLLGHLHILNNRNVVLEEENMLLKERLSSEQGTDDHSLLTTLQIERTQLRKKVAELQYLDDMVEEKQLQITFIQQQLEQRIKQTHISEQRFSDSMMENLELKSKLDDAESRISSFEKELSERDEQDRQVQELFEQKNATIGMLTEDVRRKSDRLTYIENTIHDLRSRNEGLNNAVNEKDILINELKLHVASVEERVSRLSSRLETNRKMMSKMHDEMSSAISEERTSPVIAMKPDYLSAEKENESFVNSTAL